MCTNYRVPVRQLLIDKHGGTRLSLTVLTLNGDHHPLMKRFHRQGSEKRSVIIIKPDDYDDWLGAGSIDEAWFSLKLLPAELMTAAAASLHR